VSEQSRTLKIVDVMANAVGAQPSPDCAITADITAYRLLFIKQPSLRTNRRLLDAVWQNLLPESPHVPASTATVRK
jgi:hypothetical protein